MRRPASLRHRRGCTRESTNRSRSLLSASTRESPMRRCASDRCDDAHPGFYVNPPLLIRSHLFRLSRFRPRLVAGVAQCERWSIGERGLGERGCTADDKCLVDLAVCVRRRFTACAQMRSKMLCLTFCRRKPKSRRPSWRFLPVSRRIRYDARRRTNTTIRSRLYQELPRLRSRCRSLLVSKNACGRRGPTLYRATAGDSRLGGCGAGRIALALPLVGGGPSGVRFCWPAGMRVCAGPCHALHSPSRLRVIRPKPRVACGERRHRQSAGAGGARWRCATKAVRRANEPVMAKGDLTAHDFPE